MSDSNITDRVPPDKLWRPAPRWVESELLPLLDVVRRLDHFTSDTRRVPTLWRDSNAEARLQQHLRTGRVLSLALLYPEQGESTDVMLEPDAFWRRYQIEGVRWSSRWYEGYSSMLVPGEPVEELCSVFLDDLVEGKQVRSPEDWQIFLDIATLAAAYPHSPFGSAILADRIPGPAVTPVQKAIGALAAQLKPDNSVKHGDHRTACMEQFGISGQEFDTRVWPAARELAGLSREGKRGRKKETPQGPLKKR